MHKFPPVPTYWEELESLTEYLTDCDVMFLRKKEDQKVYEDYEKSLTRPEILQNIISQMDGKKVAIIKNRFPHTNILQNFPKALHYCVWSLEGSLNNMQIRKIVNVKFPNSVWFNMTRKKGKFSIPEIWHTHIYIKNE